MTRSRQRSEPPSTPPTSEPVALPVALQPFEQLHVRDLVHDPQQMRRHTPRNIGLIGDGLNAVGAARSIVIDEHNVILAGNGTVEAAQERGFERVRVIDAVGDELIAVRRSGLTPAQKVQLALYDNRSSDVASYDLEALVRVTSAHGLDRSSFMTDVEFAELAEKELTFARAESLPIEVDGATRGVTDDSVTFSVTMSREQRDEVLQRLGEVKESNQLLTIADALLMMMRASQ